MCGSSLRWRAAAEGAVRPGIGLVVEDMHGPVANLQEVDMPSIWPGMVGRRAVGQKLDAHIWRSSAAMSGRASQIGSRGAARRRSGAAIDIGPCVDA